MLQVVLSLTLLVSTAWSSDQAKSSGSNGSSSRAFCPSGKDYLQSTLNNLAYQSPLLLDPNISSNALLKKLVQIGPLPAPLIKHECVEAALANVSAGERKQPGEKFRRNRFFRCNQSKQPIDHQDEPCDSAEYKTLMHNSFELTTLCLKEFVTGTKNKKIQNTWVEGYFKLLSTESGLHINVASQIGAIGVGQLRPEYIADFKQRTLPDLKEFLSRKETSPGCKRIASELLTDKRIDKLYRARKVTDPKTKRTYTDYDINTCANIDIDDGQPLLNLVISFANLKTFKDSVVNGLFEHSKYEGAFKGLSQEELVDLEIKMVSWAYNLGASRLVNHMQNVLDNKYPNKTVSNVRELILKSVMPGKRNYSFALDDRYKKVLGGRRSCRTDLQ